MDDEEAVRQAIWDQLPELRDSLTELERARVEDALEKEIEPYIGAYTLISDVLVDFHLLPLLDDAGSDEAALERCAGAIEQILEVYRSSLNDVTISSLEDVVAIRVVKHLLGCPERWRRFRRHAGPLLKSVVETESQYYSWPYDEPVV